MWGEAKDDFDQILILCEYLININSMLLTLLVSQLVFRG